MSHSKSILVVLVALLCSVAALAQSSLHQKRITISYNGERLGYVLRDLNANFGVNFAYSSALIATQKKVFYRAENRQLDEALGEMFDEVGIEHAYIAGQIALRPTKAKNTISPISNNEELSQDLVLESSAGDIRNTKNSSFSALNKLPQTEYLRPAGGDGFSNIDLQQYKSQLLESMKTLEPPVAKEEKLEDYTRLAQVSVLPFVGTNALKSSQITNNFSLNVFWGANGAVEGLEVGGFVNHIKNKVEGIQIAGLANTVGGDVTGTQVSGLFNITSGALQGVQVGGLFNYSGQKTKAIQASGLFNTARSGFTGLQASGVFNSSFGDSDGLQAAGIFNYSKGTAKSQVSGFFNVAGDVKWGQISSILNVAKKVNGFQIGLINIADSVGAAPIGLINIVKKGYNRVEVFAGEAMYGNLGIKFGAKGFYNMLQLGIRWDDVNKTDANGTTTRGTFTTWGVGYGLGTAMALGPRSLLNIETTAMHINSKEPWTSRLNLLGQFKLLFDWRLTRRFSVFAGPTGNVMISKLVDPETGALGVDLAPYYLYNKDHNGTNIRMWIGFNTGFRF